VKKALLTGSSLHRVRVGEPGGGVRLLGLVREKENPYLGSFSWTLRTLKVKSGAVWSFSKEQGSSELISDYGSQRSHL